MDELGRCDPVRGESTSVLPSNGWTTRCYRSIPRGSWTTFPQPLRRRGTSTSWNNIIRQVGSRPIDRFHRNPTRPN